MSIRKFGLITSFLAIAIGLPAQFNSRNGIIPTGGAEPYSLVPCGGTVSFSEDWSTGIPGTWIIEDFDTLTPRPETGLVKGWQSRKDYNDTTNWVVVSPSWYLTSGTSDDWLISPQIPISSLTCLSWRGSSQDANFRESYEVRISTTTQDTAGFFANAPLLSVSNESGNFDYHSVDLSAWSGQNVYIAFRQTSTDKFVLVLDDISLSSWPTVDAGVNYLTPQTTFAGGILEISGSFGNFGSDTIQTVDILWSIDGGAANTMSLDSLDLPPGSALNFVHSVHWFTDTVPQIYELCSWTNLPNATSDGYIYNDTFCIDVNIGDFIAVDQEKKFEFTVFPNPSDEYLMIELNGFNLENFSVTLFNMIGESIRKENWQGSKHRIDISDLQSGTYFLFVETSSGLRSYSKVIIF